MITTSEILLPPNPRLTTNNAANRPNIPPDAPTTKLDEPNARTAKLPAMDDTKNTVRKRTSQDSLEKVAQHPQRIAIKQNVRDRSVHKCDRDESPRFFPGERRDVSQIRRHQILRHELCDEDHRHNSQQRNCYGSASLDGASKFRACHDFRCGRRRRLHTVRTMETYRCRALTVATNRVSTTLAQHPRFTRRVSVAGTSG